MESNTPVTPQRNRRAGRIEALPPEQPLLVPAEQQPSRTPEAGQQQAPDAPAKPLVSPSSPASQQEQPGPARQTHHAPTSSYPANPYAARQTRQATASSYPANPYAARQTRQTTASSYPANPYATRQTQQAPASSYPATPYAAQQTRQTSGSSYPANPYAARQTQQAPNGGRQATPCAAQPRPQATGSAPYPRAVQSRPAAQRPTQPAPRPQAAPSTRPVPRDDPETRRQTALERRRSSPPPKRNAPPERSKSGQSMMASVLLVLALAVVAGLTVWIASMTTTLRNAESAQKQAWENTKFNYHVTEQSDGSFTVTWQDTIEHYAAMYNLDPAFVTAIIRNESSFRANAESSVGARGLMQMMPDTARWIAGKLGEPYDFDALYDPETSIRFGCWYLGYLSDLFQGDTVLVCAAYHAGQGEVWGWLGNPEISPDGVTIPIENIPITNTRTYAGRVTQAYGIYEALLYPEPVQEADVHGSGHADADRVSAADR